MRLSLLWVSVAFVAAASARDWGFSKDIAHQRNIPNPKDTVYLVNHRTDTLRLDSAFVSIVQAPGSNIAVWMGASFRLTPPGSGYSVGMDQRGFRFTNVLGRLAPGDTLILTSFDPQPCLCVTKRAATGDSLKARVRFRADNGEEDTLIVYGVEDALTGIRGPEVPRSGLWHEPDSRDLRGRSVSPATRIPTVRVPLRR